jgi:hypothetical protein
MSKKEGPTTPAGWYADPQAPASQQRYWDGMSWTEHTHPEPAAVAATRPIQPVEPTKDTPFTVKGVNGQVTFDAHFVTITRQGFAARVTIGKGDKRLPVSSIAAVQWKPAGPMMNGFIQFTVGGSNERRSAFGHQTMSAVHDENSVVFTKTLMPKFQTLRALIEDAIVVAHRPFTMPATVAPSAELPTQLQQLRELGELHANGIVSDDEFAKLKAQLLAGQ